MQAIRTRYFGPTNTRGACIIATCSAKRKHLPYRHELNVEDNHKQAARELIASLGWDKDHREYQGFATGQLSDGSYAHVLLDRITRPEK